jgi:hypothetical protein
MIDQWWNAPLGYSTLRQTPHLIRFRHRRHGALNGDPKSNRNGNGNRNHNHSPRPKGARNQCGPHCDLFHILLQ